MELCDEESVDSGRLSNEPCAPVQPNCILTVGTQRLPAIFVDHRDDGLYVLIQGSPLFWVEDTGVLRTPEAEIMVRVANIVRMDRDEDHTLSSRPAFCIGLAKLEQTAAELSSQAIPIPVQEGAAELLSPRPPHNRLHLIVGGVIACALIITPLVFVAVAWQHHARSAALPTAGTVRADEISRSQNEYRSDKPVLSADLLLLPGVEPFLNAEVARMLALTPLQMGALRQLDKTTQYALQDLEKYWDSIGRMELARRRYALLEAACQEAVQLLTDQQRQQWESMIHPLMCPNHDE